MSINSRYLSLSHDEVFRLWRQHSRRHSYLLRLDKPTERQVAEIARLTRIIAELEYVLAAWRSQMKLPL